jgi:hypothetical protein
MVDRRSKFLGLDQTRVPAAAIGALRRQRPDLVLNML